MLNEIGKLWELVAQFCSWRIRLSSGTRREWSETFEVILNNIHTHIDDWVPIVFHLDLCALVINKSLAFHANRIVCLQSSMQACLGCLLSVDWEIVNLAWPMHAWKIKCCDNYDVQRTFLNSYFVLLWWHKKITQYTL